MPSHGAGHQDMCRDTLVWPAASATPVSAAALPLAAVPPAAVPPAPTLSMAAAAAAEVDVAATAEKGPDVRTFQRRCRQREMIGLRRHFTCLCMLRNNMLLSLLWLILLPCASGCATHNGMQKEVSFKIPTGGHPSGDCVGDAGSLRLDSTLTWADAGLVQSRMSLGRKSHDVHDEDAGLPGVDSRAASRVLAWSPSQRLSQIAASIHTAAKLARDRMDVPWWLWLFIAAVLICFLASIATMDLPTQRKEIIPAQAASAGKHIHKGRTHLQEQGNTLSSGVLTSASLSPLSKKSLTLPHTCSSTDPPRLASDDIPCLCPEMVVPATCECVLRVALKPVAFVPVAVMDTDGNQVLRVSIQGSKSSQAASPCDSRRVVLTTDDGFIVAQCRGSQQVDVEFHMLRTDGELFGKLWQCETKSCSNDSRECTVYTLSMAGAEWRFAGSVAEEKMEVTDSEGRLLAMLRPETGPGGRSPMMPNQDSFDDNGQVCLLRVASHADVSIVLCGLLTIANLM